MKHILILAFVLAAASAFGQSNPSLKDTLQWMQHSLAAGGGYYDSDPGSTALTYLHFNGCVLTDDLSDHAYAVRFTKALRHAVELCGGKPSTF
jgi:hypothetical protein